MKALDIAKIIFYLMWAGVGIALILLLLNLTGLIQQLPDILGTWFQIPDWPEIPEIVIPEWPAWPTPW